MDQNHRILDHDWTIYLSRSGNVSGLTLSQVQLDGFEPHLKALYGGDLDKAKRKYDELMGAVERG